MIKGPAGVTYFAGDTGDGPHFDEIKKRFGAPRLALLPIGAYQPAWFMSGVHVNPAEALRAHDRLGAGTSVGIHFGTFPLADDGQDEPLGRPAAGTVPSCRTTPAFHDAEVRRGSRRAAAAVARTIRR